ncbi:hypothetical protein [Spirosoma sp.]|uniref:hypothetical protein n=1 Tax=Spirosoma sp. TaxID=1899569 RepID=UPI002625A8BA|nr:hypothetical protein [Spirosoma sp.]MCX6216343.1 hypothetical protein [Spirosoma sp.]
MTTQEDLLTYGVRPFATLLICLLFHAGTVSLIDSPLQTDGTVLKPIADLPLAPMERIRQLYEAFISLAVFGYWLPYTIPVLLIYVMAPFVKKQHSFFVFILLSTSVWVLTGGVLNWVLRGPSNMDWVKWPTITNWCTAPGFGLIGLVYGLLYWEWYINRPPEDHLAS